MTQAIRHSGLRQARRYRAVTALLLAALAAAPTLGGPMEREKLYDVPVQAEVLHPRLQGLLAEALEQPDRLTRLEALADVVHHHLTDLSPRVGEMLSGEDPLLRGSALRALVALDARDQAEAVLAVLRESRWEARGEADVLLAADRALARWRVDAAVPAWSARLEEGKAPAALLQSAAAGLGGAPVAEAESAWQLLTAVVRDAQRPPSLRLICARSAAVLEVAALQKESVAAALIERAGAIEQLLAAEILQEIDSSGAAGQLVELATSGEPAARVAAMRALLRVAPRTLAERAEPLLGAEDAETRRLALRAIKNRPQAGSIAPVASVLDDLHPAVRREARLVLLAFAGEADLADGVRQVARDMLVRSGPAPGSAAAGPSWRAVEQAAMISAALGDKPSAQPLAALLAHERFEVRLAAVVALRQLNVKATHASVLRLVRDLVPRQIEIQEKIVALQLHRVGTDDPRRLEAVRLNFRADRNDQLGAEAAQALGAWRLRAAEPFLRRVIPKKMRVGARFRTAAIWALGHLREDGEEPALARQLLERAFDLSLTDPEFQSVRRASVIALGRMRAKSVVTGLRDRYENDGADIRSASRWALQRITGETLPAISLKPHVRTDAFISPLP